MATVEDFYEALNHYVADAEKLRLIVQGDETTVVSTMFGPIDSVAKTIAEIEAEINAAGTGWLALAEAAADDAQSSANDAVAAAMASGIDAFANTYADAQTAAGSLQVGDSIMIFTDENASDSLTVRLVESGGTLSVVKANFTAPSPLLSSTAPGEGASLVKYPNGLTVEQAFPAVQVPDLYTLANSTWLQIDGLQVQVASVVTDVEGLGGGIWYYDANEPRSNANFGTIFDPGALNGWDGTTVNLDTTIYFSSGQGSGSGSGCWVRRITNKNDLDPELFGCVTGGPDTRTTINAACEHLEFIGGGVLRLKPYTTYVLASTGAASSMIVPRKNVSIIGEQTTLLSHVAKGRIIYPALPSDQWYNLGVLTYKGLIFQHYDPSFSYNIPSPWVNPEALSIGIRRADEIYVIDCESYNNPGRQELRIGSLQDTKYVSVKNFKANNVAESSPYAVQQNDHSFMYIVAEEIELSGVDLSNDTTVRANGIENHGKVFAAKNCRFHQISNLFFMVNNKYPEMETATVENVVATECSGLVDFWDSYSGTETTGIDKVVFKDVSYISNRSSDRFIDVATRWSGTAYFRSLVLEDCHIKETNAAITSAEFFWILYQDKVKLLNCSFDFYRGRGAWVATDGVELIIDDHSEFVYRGSATCRAVFISSTGVGTTAKIKNSSVRALGGGSIVGVENGANSTADIIISELYIGGNADTLQDNGAANVFLSIVNPIEFPVIPGSSSFSNLTSPSGNDRPIVYVNDALRSGETTGNGSGTLAWWDGNEWRTLYDNSILQN